MIKFKGNKENVFIETSIGLINVLHIVRCYYDTYHQSYMIDVDSTICTSNSSYVVSYSISKQNYDKIYKRFCE